MIKAFFKAALPLISVYLIGIASISYFIGPNGLVGDIFEENSFIILVIYAVVVTHITITSMSLSLHRYHTHKGVTLNKFLDAAMQINVWAVGGMSKLDWVSVHIYHHAFSDRKEDPHSPVQKGIMHILLMGVFDYAEARISPPVVKIRKTLKTNKLERFMADHSMLGTILLTIFNLIVFGPLWGSILSATNFLVSPIFAVGGVNGLAHWWGYRNHNYPDNSRNLGFVLPLNFLICGELDHNNHHAHPKSCSFRHKWYEFDWGFFYINILTALGLADVKNAYTTQTLKRDMSIHISTLLDRDFRFKHRAEELAAELNTSYQELLKTIEDYLEGKKISVSSEVKDLIAEAKRTFYANYRLGLKYN